MDAYRLTMEQISRYGRYLCTEERSSGTVTLYLGDIGAFARWLGDAPVTKELAAGWKEHLLHAGYEPSTVNGKLTALDRFFDFMGWSDCKVKHLKRQRRLFRDDSRELTKEEYERLIETAEGLGKERLSLLMESICGTGIRVSEVQYLTVEAAQQGKVEI